MIDLDRELARSRQFRETIGIGRDQEGDELHRAYLIGRHLALVEARRDAIFVKNEPQMMFQADQARKFNVALGWIRIFDEQGSEEFARARYQFVVGFHLGIDSRVLEDA